METQKVTNSQTSKDKFNQNNSIKFETESIKLSLCDYSMYLLQL